MHWVEAPLAYVDPSAKIGNNVTVHPFAYIDKNVEIGDDNEIMPYASLMSGTRMGNGNKVYQGAVVAAVPQDFAYKGEDTIARVGNNNVIRENAVIIRGTHADHETSIGDGNFIMNGSQVSGCCTIYDYSILTSNVLMQGNTRLGSFSVVQGGCRFVRDIPPYIVAAHEPIEFYSINTIVLERFGFSETLIKHIAQAYRILYKANTSQHDALIRIREQVPHSKEIDNIIQFVESSKLGIIH